jgi:hypothetical protein
MNEEHKELNSEEKAIIESQLNKTRENIRELNNSLDELVNISKEILKGKDFNPYEEIDELTEEAKEIYSQIIMGIENPLKVPHKEYKREVNVLLTEKFLSKILISEEDFIIVYKEAFGK